MLGKAENLVGHVRPGNVSVVVWAFRGPEGAFRGLRALRDLSGLHALPSAFAPGRDHALASGHRRQRPHLGARPRARACELRCTPQGGVSMAHQRDRVARAIDAKISSEPFVGGAELPPEPRLDLLDAGRPARFPPGSPRTICRAASTPRSRTVRARPDARDPLHGDRAAASLARRYRALGLLGGASTGHLRGADPWQLRGLRLGVPERQGRARRAERVEGATGRARHAGSRGASARCASSGPAGTCGTTSSGCAGASSSRSAATGRLASRCCSPVRSWWRASSRRTRPPCDECLGLGAGRRASRPRLRRAGSGRRARAPDRPSRSAAGLAHRRYRLWPRRVRRGALGARRAGHGDRLRPGDARRDRRPRARLRARRGRRALAPAGLRSHDAACLVQVLEYVPDPVAALREAARIVRPGESCSPRTPTGIPRGSTCRIAGSAAASCRPGRTASPTAGRVAACAAG